MTFRNLHLEMLLVLTYISYIKQSLHTINTPRLIAQTA